MANGIIPVTPGTGLNLQSYVNTVGGNTVHSEAVTLTDSSGAETGIVANPLTTKGTIAVANAANPVDIEAALASLSVDLGGNLRSLSYFSDSVGDGVPAAPVAAIVSNAEVGSGPNFAYQLLASHVAPGETAGNGGLPFAADLIAGITNDSTPEYQPIPLGTAGRSVIIEGVAGGTPIPISGTITATIAPNSSVNLTQVAGTALGATAVTNFGAAPAAAAVPGVNASIFAGTTGITATGSSINVNITNTVPVSGTIAATQSGAWTVGISAAQTIAVTNAGTFAVQATLSAETTKVIGTVNQGTSPWVVSLASTTITGTVSVTQGTSPWIVAGGGTAGSAATGVVTVQGIAGGTTLPVTATIAAAQTIAVTNAGTFAVQATIIAGSAIIGKVDILGNAGATLDSAAGTPNSQALTIQGNASGVAVPVSGTVTANAGTGTMSVQEVVGTTGGASTSFTNGTGGATSISVKGSAGQIYGYYLDNTANTVTSYFQFFNAASATLGSTAPTFVVPVPAGSAANLSLPMGIAFGTGIRIGVATTYNGGSAVANACNFTVWYD